MVVFEPFFSERKSLMESYNYHCCVGECHNPRAKLGVHSGEKIDTRPRRAVPVGRR